MSQKFVLKTGFPIDAVPPQQVFSIFKTTSCIIAAIYSLFTFQTWIGCYQLHETKPNEVLTKKQIFHKMPEAATGGVL